MNTSYNYLIYLWSSVRWYWHTTRVIVIISKNWVGTVNTYESQSCSPDRVNDLHSIIVVDEGRVHAHLGETMGEGYLLGVSSKPSRPTLYHRVVCGSTSPPASFLTPHRPPARGSARPSKQQPHPTWRGPNPPQAAAGHVCVGTHPKREE